jgi:hypothetical protein
MPASCALPGGGNSNIRRGTRAFGSFAGPLLLQLLLLAQRNQKATSVQKVQKHQFRLAAALSKKVGEWSGVGYAPNAGATFLLIQRQESVAELRALLSQYPLQRVAHASAFDKVGRPDPGLCVPLKVRHCVLHASAEDHRRARRTNRVAWRCTPHRSQNNRMKRLMVATGVKSDCWGQEVPRTPQQARTTHMLQSGAAPTILRPVPVRSGVPYVCNHPVAVLRTRAFPCSPLDLAKRAYAHYTKRSVAEVVQTEPRAPVEVELFLCIAIRFAYDYIVRDSALRGLADQPFMRQGFHCTSSVELPICAQQAYRAITPAMIQDWRIQSKDMGAPVRMLQNAQNPIVQRTLRMILPRSFVNDGTGVPSHVHRFGSLHPFIATLLAFASECHRLVREALVSAPSPLQLPQQPPPPIPTTNPLYMLATVALDPISAMEGEAMQVCE